MHKNYKNRSVFNKSPQFQIKIYFIYFFDKNDIILKTFIIAK